MTDPLLDRYYALCNMQNIPSVEVYAQQWDELACMALLEGRPALAGMCISRAAFYYEVAEALSGEYVRLIDRSFSELIPV